MITNPKGNPNWRKGGPSPNPAGKRKGTPDIRLRFRALMDADAPALVAKAVELAKAGNPHALRLCIERLVPVARDISIELPGLAEGTHSERAEAVMQAVADGRLSPEQGAQGTTLLQASLRIREIDELERRIVALEQATKT